MSAPRSDDDLSPAALLRAWMSSNRERDKMVAASQEALGEKVDKLGDKIDAFAARTPDPRLIHLYGLALVGACVTMTVYVLSGWMESQGVDSHRAAESTAKVVEAAGISIDDDEDEP